jgi:hypothetical protein
MHLPKFLRFGRSRSKTPAPADSREPDRISSSHGPPAAHASSVRPSASPEPSQHSKRPPTSGIIKYSLSQLIPLLLPPTLCWVAQLPNPIMHHYRSLRVQYPKIHILHQLLIPAVRLTHSLSMLLHRRTPHTNTAIYWPSPNIFRCLQQHRNSL